MTERPGPLRDAADRPAFPPRPILVLSLLLVICGGAMLAVGLGWFAPEPSDITTAAATDGTTEAARVTPPRDDTWMRPLTVAGGIIGAAGVGLMMLAFSKLGRPQRR